jgi:diguanylate cyclase (GGDEF)-like protein
LRNADQYARAEGGEFQLLLLDTSPETASATCEEIRAAIARGQWVPANPDARITVSIGICNRSSEKTFEATLAAAEQALEQDRKSASRLSSMAEQR